MLNSLLQNVNVTDLCLLISNSYCICILFLSDLFCWPLHPLIYERHKENKRRNWPFLQQMMTSFKSTHFPLRKATFLLMKMSLNARNTSHARLFVWPPVPAFYDTSLINTTMYTFAVIVSNSGKCILFCYLIFSVISWTFSAIVYNWADIRKQILLILNLNKYV